MIKKLNIITVIRLTFWISIIFPTLMSNLAGEIGASVTIFPSVEKRLWKIRHDFIITTVVSSFKNIPKKRKNGNFFLWGKKYLSYEGFFLNIYCNLISNFLKFITQIFRLHLKENFNLFRMNLKGLSIIGFLYKDNFSHVNDSFLKFWPNIYNKLIPKST